MFVRRASRDSFFGSMSLAALALAAVLAILARPAEARVVDLEEFKSELSNTRAIESIRFMSEDGTNHTEVGDDDELEDEDNEDEDEDEDDDSAAGIVAAAGVTIAALSFAV